MPSADSVLDRLRELEGENSALWSEVQTLRAQLTAIRSSRVYRLAQVLKRWSLRLAPVGSRRQALICRLFWILGTILKAGEHWRRKAPQHCTIGNLSPAERPSRGAPTDRPRVLVQVDRFGQGGLEQVVVDLLAALRGKGIQVVLLAVEEKALPSALTRLADVAQLSSGERDASYRNLLVQERIDLVSSHYSLYGAGVAFSLGIPFVQTVQNSYVWLTPAQIAAHREADRFTRAYVCVSREVARYSHEKLGLSAAKMHCVPNGVALERFGHRDSPDERRRLRGELGIPQEAFVFLNVASIFPPKAQRLALRALHRLGEGGKDAGLVFLGGVFDAEYQEQLLADMRAFGLTNRVVFAGRRAEVAPFYHAADAFLLPSFWEGCSLALAEALLVGLPCVISRVGSAEEFADLPGVECVAPPFGSMLNLDHRNLNQILRADHPEFVDRLAQAMSKVRDHPVRPVLSPAQRQALDRDTMTAGYIQLFTELVHGQAAGRAA